MAALGEIFRSARESQGLTLSDVAERIHIRSLYLAAIEAEDWNAIGPPVYIRGFVRAYARCLKLDPDAALARFADGSGSTPAPPVILAPSPRGEPSISGLSRGDARKPGLSLGAVIGLLVAFALLLFVGYEFVGYQRQLSHSDATTSGVPVGVAPSAQHERAVRDAPRAVVARAGAKVDPRLAGASGFLLRLRENSWLRVVVDGKLAMEGVYPKGTARTFSGRTVTVRAGNAGGVEIAVDGKALSPLGGLGDVAERSFQL